MFLNVFIYVPDNKVQMFDAIWNLITNLVHKNVSDDIFVIYF